MLSPNHFGVLSQLIHDAIKKYPESDDKEKIHKLIEKKVEYELMPWEQHLYSGIEVARSLDKTFPDSNDLIDEIELLVTYYGDRIESK